MFPRQQWSKIASLLIIFASYSTKVSIGIDEHFVLSWLVGLEFRLSLGHLVRMDLRYLKSSVTNDEN